jgi:DNA-binding response OmpR family regulator
MSIIKILVVEDDLLLSKVLNYKLSARGYQVHTAYNAREAAEITKMASPEVVILDLGLPVADPSPGKQAGGFGFLEWLNENVAANRPPVIVLSAWSALNAEPLARKLGAAAYLQKPAEDRKLFAAIDSALKQKPGMPAHAPNKRSTDA